MRTLPMLMLLIAMPAMPQTLEKPKPLFHTFKLSQTEVGVNCVNGGVPSVKTLGSLVVVSCAK
jgi:hypothetical protein